MKNKEFLIKILALIIISFIYFHRALIDFEKPYVNGDGFEYILMTEAFTNHFSPDILLSDVESFKKKCQNHYNWQEFPKRNIVDDFINYFKTSKNVFRESNMGLYCSKDKKWYSYHFFFYSLVNLPMYTTSKYLGPLKPFYITNALLVILTCFVFLYFSSLSLLNSILAAGCFCFSSAYWYTGWQHTEILTMSLLAIGLTFYFQKKHFIALILVALSSLQNQPLFILLLFMCIIAAIEFKWELKRLIKIGLVLLIAMLPPLFYSMNFNTTSLIKDDGFLDSKYITLNRILGFFFDPSQGMILTIPVILIVYIVFNFRFYIRLIFKKENYNSSILFPFIILSITAVISAMAMWNHSMAIISRYASWVSVIIMVHVFFLTNNLSKKYSTILFCCFLGSQIVTTLYHEKFNTFDWSSETNRPVAKWLLRKHPTWYNPDPCIFTSRTQGIFVLLPEESPYVYAYKGKLKKVLINESKTDSLKKYGFTDNAIEEIKNTTGFNFGWGYIKSKFLRDQKTRAELVKIFYERKIRAVMDKIRLSPEWMEQVKTKATERKIGIEDAIRDDATWVINEEEKNEQ